MKKVVSYRRTLIELAKIYKIDKFLNTNIKLTTYEIELELLRNKVPIPSRRGYFSHKIVNELINPFILYLKENLSINLNLNKILKIIFSKINNYFNFIFFSIKNFFKVLTNTINPFNFNLKENLSINLNLNKILKIIFSKINNYFNFIFFSIKNFFKVLTKTIIESLNEIYHLKIQEKLIKKIILGGVYSFSLVVLISSGFYIKNFINEGDSFKISLEIKSDKKEIVKTPDIPKKNKSKKLAKKPEVSKKPYDPETDYKLDTQTVLNLFEDLEYDLDNVRNKKLVKPIYFTRLPKDLDSIRSNSRKKETFLKILLPLVVAENERIQKDRSYLLKIIKENQSKENTNWINKKYKEYKIPKKNIDELIEKLDIIPNSIALAQAAKESGWGTSRFALEGNAIFGQWTWNGVGMAPLEKDENKNHKILKFPLLRASVKAYITNLNTHSGYKSFRKKRLELRTNNKNLSGLDLIHELDNYAETGKEYTKVLEQIIKQNDLDEFETVTIDDFKKESQVKL
jgi:Bax protein